MDARYSYTGTERYSSLWRFKLHRRVQIYQQRQWNRPCRRKGRKLPLDLRTGLEGFLGGNAHFQDQSDANRKVAYSGTLETRRGLRGRRHLLFPAVVRDRRTRCTSQPIVLSAILRAFQRPRQYRLDRPPLLRLCNARDPSVQQAGQPHFLQGRVCGI